MPTPECARPEGAACYEVAPGQACSGRLAPAAAAAATAAAAAAAMAARPADVRSELVQRAHARGLVVHPYTFRNEVLQLWCRNHATKALSLFRQYERLGGSGSPQVQMNAASVRSASQHLRPLRVCWVPVCRGGSWRWILMQTLCWS